ncbi:MAG: hypothetical protein KAI24_06850 [Planctomycetes bacterium]|nr:hypothetical protein [Planctomycetota bacterium]
MTFDERTLSVSDDSGLLALVDPDAYQGFVGADWELREVVARFLEQMGLARLIIWGTGAEGEWTCRIQGRADLEGFRQVEGTITSSNGRLFLTNYESLTNVAQFADETLPPEHEADNVIRVPPGTYRCRITQLFDPDGADAESRDCHFVLELSPSTGAPTWTKIPWSSLDEDQAGQG